MSEVITLQVGSCGIDIGNQFWNRVSKDHWLDEAGRFINKSNIEDETRLNKIHRYFTGIDGNLCTEGYIRENIEIKYKHLNNIPNDIKNLCYYFYGQAWRPRAILIDSDINKIDEVKTSNISNIFRTKSFINGCASFENNWAKGYLTEGIELLDEIMSRINKEIEECDSFQGFQLCHSIGGGTGSGLSSLIMQQLNDYYPKKINMNFQVYPSHKMSDVVVEPYNAILTINKFFSYSNLNCIIDNNALYHIIHNILKQKEPKYSHINWIISLAINDVTAPLRFDGLQKLNCSLKRYSINMCPFPRLNNMLMSYAPLYMPGQGRKIRYKLTVQELTDQMWSSRNYFCNVRSEDGKILSESNMYRGNIAIQEVDDEVAKIAQKMADDYVSWIPNLKKADITGPPPIDTTMSGIWFVNTTAIKGVYCRICNSFTKIFKRKAFLHWYKGEGMGEMEFEEAYKNLLDLITEYQDQQDVVVDLDSDYDEDEDDDYTEDDEDDEDEYPY